VGAIGMDILENEANPNFPESHPIRLINAIRRIT
jgi:hypothetical protein